jgi:hypothetical protein
VSCVVLVFLFTWRGREAETHPKNDIASSSPNQEPGVSTVRIGNGSEGHADGTDGATDGEN